MEPSAEVADDERKSALIIKEHTSKTHSAGTPSRIREVASSIPTGRSRNFFDFSSVLSIRKFINKKCLDDERRGHFTFNIAIIREVFLKSFHRNNTPFTSCGSRCEKVGFLWKSETVEMVFLILCKEGGPNIRKNAFLLSRIETCSIRWGENWVNGGGKKFVPNWRWTGTTIGKNIRARNNFFTLLVYRTTKDSFLSSYTASNELVGSRALSPLSLYSPWGFPSYPSLCNIKRIS